MNVKDYLVGLEEQCKHISSLYAALTEEFIVASSNAGPYFGATTAGDFVLYVGLDEYEPSPRQIFITFTLGTYHVSCVAGEGYEYFNTLDTHVTIEDVITRINTAFRTMQTKESDV